MDFFHDLYGQFLATHIYICTVCARKDFTWTYNAFYSFQDYSLKYKQYIYSTSVAYLPKKIAPERSILAMTPNAIFSRAYCSSHVKATRESRLLLLLFHRAPILPKLFSYSLYLLEPFQKKTKKKKISKRNIDQGPP